MPRSISYRKLVAKLKRAGCSGPFSGAKHPFMRCDGVKLFIPNPHGVDVGPKIVKRIITVLGVSEEEFENL